MKKLCTLAFGCFLLGLLTTFAEEKKEAQESALLKELAGFFSGYKAGFVLLDLQSGDILRYHPEICATGYSPCSTFKIPNSLIGLETEVIPDVDTKWKWDGVTRSFPDWNKDQTMRTAIAVSCVPYYQDLAAKVGAERMKQYLSRIHYGNEDISGGLTTFWLESSLKISPDEQLEFLRKLVLNQVPFSQRSIDLVKEIMIIPQDGHGVLRGKTGSGMDKEGHFTLGWFVGYVTQDGKTYLFVTMLADGPNPSGKVARKITIDILKDLKLL